MKRRLVSVLLQIVCISSFAFDVDVISCNLWRKNDSWPTRKQNVINLIVNESPDVVGLQEGDEGKQEELDLALPEYKLETGPWGDRSSGILYDDAALLLVESGNFGFSSDPDNPTVRDWGDGAIHGWLRKCTWVLLEFKATGNLFYVYNTHLDANGFSPDPGYWRSQEVRLLAERISQRDQKDIPFVLVGDLNGNEGEEAIEYLKVGSGNPVPMVDTYREILPNGPGDTFGSVKYDYIMVADEAAVTTKDASIIYHSSYGWTSDHQQVKARVSFSKPSSTVSVKALSFNVRVGVDGGDFAWDVRKSSCISLINREAPDFMGIQEAFPSQKDDLDHGLPNYNQFGRGREANGGGEGSQIFYLNTKWKLDQEEYGTFQLSPTPEVWGSNGWGFQYLRICTWGRFENLETGEHIYVYNTHYPLSYSGRVNCSNLIANRIAARIHGEDPVVLMGDFNADENEEAILILKGELNSPIQMVDTWREINPTNIYKGTFSGWSNTPSTGPKIDYVFVQGQGNITDAAIVYQENGEIVSDHFPIYAVVSIGTEYQKPPSILNVSRNVSVPNDQQFVEIRTRISSDTSLKSVKLNWGESEQDLVNEIVMNEEGDDYVGLIPNRPDLTTVYYQVNVLDDRNQIGESIIYSYRVDNSPELLLADFDDIDLNFTGFGGNTFTKVSNNYSGIINPSSFVGSTVHGVETWGGIVSDRIESIDFQSTPLFKMLVHAPVTGRILVKFEDATNQQLFYEKEYLLTAKDQWVEVTIDFSEAPSNVYEKVVLFFDFGNSSNEEFLFDNIRLLAPEEDCSGELNGKAFLDVCGACVGGSTGKEAETDINKCITSVDRSLEGAFVDVFPNPLIDGREVYLSKSANWELFTMRGRLLSSGYGSEVMFNGISPGVYLLMVEGEMVKVIKQ